MGSLTRFLQEAFAATSPKGWACEAEVPLVDRAAAKRLGFEPRADVRLTEQMSNRRIWVEFEVSRADPVANHAKFATAALLEGLSQDDSFVSMASRHIVPGRTALAAGTTVWMRSLGIPAFQVDLLPQFDSQTIKNLNAQTLSVQDDLGHIPVKAEVERVIAVTNSVPTASGHRIHKADNPYTVAVNIRRWNAEMQTREGRLLWGRRRVRFFVFDPATGLFAPSKFCAFVPGPAFQVDPSRVGLDVSASRDSLGMTIAICAALGEQDPRFDGHVARRHLQEQLGYTLLPIEQARPVTQENFKHWQSSVDGVNTVAAGPLVLDRTGPNLQQIIYSDDPA